VTLHAGDPQGDPLSGQIRITAEEGITVGRSNSTTQPATAGSFLMGIPVRGSGYRFRARTCCCSTSTPFFQPIWASRAWTASRISRSATDLAASRESTSIKSLTCPSPPDAVLPLRPPVWRVPAARRFHRTRSPRFRRAHEDAISIRVDNYPFDGGIPGEIGLSSLGQQQRYRLSITVTDGTSLPVGVEATFLHQRESIMVFLGALADTDRDGIDDSADPCTDTDGDSLGDPGFPAQHLSARQLSARAESQSGGCR